MEKGYRDYGHDMDNTDTLLVTCFCVLCGLAHALSALHSRQLHMCYAVNHSLIQYIACYTVYTMRLHTACPAMLLAATALHHSSGRSGVCVPHSVHATIARVSLIVHVAHATGGGSGLRCRLEEAR